MTFHPSASVRLAFFSSLLKATVDWMIGEGVKVINHSIGLGIEAPGNGSSGLAASKNHILDVINHAVNNGIIWVNSGGNDAEKPWYGPYTDGTTTNRWHDFATAPDTDEGNTISLTANKTVVAELRWDDSWGGADCDLNRSQGEMRRGIG